MVGVGTTRGLDEPVAQIERLAEPGVFGWSLLSCCLQMWDDRPRVGMGFIETHAGALGPGASEAVGFDCFAHAGEGSIVKTWVTTSSRLPNWAKS